jgi:putative nucleotidyltransferase with HDIG domain
VSPPPVSSSPPSGAGVRVDPSGLARAYLTDAISHDRDNRPIEAIKSYQLAIGQAERENDVPTLAEALRLLATAHSRQNQVEMARVLCRRSQQAADSAALPLLAAQALVTLADCELSDGALVAARESLLAALDAGGADPRLCGRIEQALGEIARRGGDLAAATTHLERAFEALEEANDEPGCATVCNALGALGVEQHRWMEADDYCRRCLDITARTGDVRLRGMALITLTGVHIPCGRYVAAQRDAEEALLIFDALEDLGNKSDAYRALGVAYRCVGRKTLAEARLTAAVELARKAGSILQEAESLRELALLYCELGRHHDALRLLGVSHELLHRLDPRTAAVHVAARLETLRDAFVAVALEWGQSIESSDSYTQGHCERVAASAIAVGRALGLEGERLMALQLGAYLHDVGKLRVPHELLNKPGHLTDAEFETMQRHPVDGVAMLNGVEFPWDILPIVRWHHERFDGSGYPNGLKGAEIPLNAQIVGIADVYDALTTTRSFRPALSKERALGTLDELRHWWRADVHDAFLATTRDVPQAPPTDL